MFDHFRRQASQSGIYEELHLVERPFEARVKSDGPFCARRRGLSMRYRVFAAMNGERSRPPPSRTSTIAVQAAALCVESKIDASLARFFFNQSHWSRRLQEVNECTAMLMNAP
jgi:hypothetical protein